MYETYFSLLPGYSSTSFATSCTKTGVVSIESLTHEGLGKDSRTQKIVLWPFSGGRSIPIPKPKVPSAKKESLWTCLPYNSYRLPRAHNFSVGKNG